MSRAERAGEVLGKAIVEIAHLMYQHRTSWNFLKGLKQAIDSELKRRHREWPTPTERR